MVAEPPRGHRSFFHGMFKSGACRSCFVQDCLGAMASGSRFRSTEQHTGCLRRGNFIAGGYLTVAAILDIFKRSRIPCCVVFVGRFIVRPTFSFLVLLSKNHGDHRLWPPFLMPVLLSAAIPTGSVVYSISAAINRHFTFRFDLAAHKAFQPPPIIAIINRILR